MNILFVLENLSEKCGANVNVAIKIIKELRKQNDVYVVARYDSDKQIDEKKASIFSGVKSFYCDEQKKAMDFTSKGWQNASLIKKILKCIAHPLIFFRIIDIKYFDSSLTKRKYIRHINEAYKEWNIDVTIGVTAPYFIAKALANIKNGGLKTIFQLDPYTNNYLLPKKLQPLRKNIECSTAKRLDILFVVDYVEREMRKLGIVESNKLISVGFPGITDVTTKNQQVKKETIDFIYAGRLYDDIRNPLFLYELMTKLPDNYVLHMVGGGCENITDHYKNILGDRLRNHGWVSSEEADNYVQMADILISLNNTIVNQMSSKLLDYISTGKPIINITKNPDCPSLDYMNKYKNGISIKEELNNDVVNKVIGFVDNNFTKRIDHKVIKDLFIENTDEYVSDRMISAINRKKSEEESR